VFPSPSAESREEYLAAGVFLAVAEEGKLVFECEEVPTIDLFVDIQITEPLTNIGGACGAFSWNDLTDKPFGEEGLEPITWDGNAGDRTIVDANENNTYFVKMNDMILSTENLVGATLSLSNGYELIVTSDMVFSDIGGVTFVEFAVCSVSDATAFSEFINKMGIQATFTETGTYFITAGGGTLYTTSVTFPSALKTLDDKFIPDTIARVSDLQEALGAYITDINALIGGDE
jgi:hypothetical protein